MFAANSLFRERCPFLVVPRWSKHRSGRWHSEGSGAVNNDAQALPRTHTADSPLDGWSASPVISATPPRARFRAADSPIQALSVDESSASSVRTALIHLKADLNTFKCGSPSDADYLLIGGPPALTSPSATTFLPRLPGSAAVSVAASGASDAQHGGAETAAGRTKRQAETGLASGESVDVRFVCS